MDINNDYELLYLYKIGNKDALNLLLEKYSRHIYKTIHDFHITHNVEDYYLEGQISLWEAAKAFNDDFNKTFTKFFDVILRRKMSALISKEPKYILKESFDDVKELSDEPTVNFDYYQYSILFKGIEKDIYQMYYVENLDKKTVIDALNITDERTFHNALYRIKNKIITEYNSNKD